MRRLIPAILFAALIAGCSTGLIKPKVEKGIEKALPSYIGPAKEYDVKASGSETSMLKGKFDALHITGRDVLIAENLKVSKLTVDMQDVRVDTSTRKLKAVGSTVFQGTVTEDAVNDYINATRPEGKEMRVELESGRLTVIARPNFHGIGAQVKVTGKPKIERGTQVSFVADSASLSIVPVPASIVNKLLERVNPVLDLNEMKFPVTLTAVTIKKDAVDLAGKADFKP